MNKGLTSSPYYEYINGPSLMIRREIYFLIQRKFIFPDKYLSSPIWPACYDSPLAGGLPLLCYTVLFCFSLRCTFLNFATLYFFLPAPS